MTVIARVTSQDPHTMLGPLLDAPLGLDVWEVKPAYVVLQASEAQLERLEQMG
jgi:carboxypeptidase T